MLMESDRIERIAGMNPRRLAMGVNPWKWAFTIIELLIVIAIIIILVSVSLPLVSKMMQNNSQTQAVNMVTAYLANARGEAIVRKRQVGVVFYEQTAAYASPYNKNQTAVMLCMEDPNQSQYYKSPDVPGTTITIFMAMPGRSPEYLPNGIKLATLDDNASNNNDNTDTVFRLQEESSSSRRTRVIMFDANGQLILRNGLGRADLTMIPFSSDPAGGKYKITGDWAFTTPKGTPSDAVTSPAVVVYDGRTFDQAAVAGNDNNVAKWMKANADILIVNAYTGNVLR